MAIELFLEAEAASVGRTREVANNFGSVSALTASLLVNATGKLFGSVPNELLAINDKRARDEYDSESDTSEFKSDGETNQIDAVASRPNHKLPISGRLARPLLSLEYLMSTLNAFETTVPHDTVYALLSIAQDAMPSTNLARITQSSSISVLRCMTILVTRKQFDIDYTRPFVDVCREFVEHCIRGANRDNRYRALDVLCRPWACKQEDLDRRRRDFEDQRRLKRKDRGQYKTHNGISSGDLYAISQRNRAALRVSMLGEGLLPTWIPQLGNAPFELEHRKDSLEPGVNRKNADSLVGLPSPEKSFYSASGTYRVDLKTLKFRKTLTSKVELDHSSMFTKGFVLDTLLHVEDTAVDGHIPMSWAERAGWRAIKGSPPEVLWRTLVANRTGAGALPPTFWQKACEEAFRKHEGASTSIDTTRLMKLGHNSLVSQYCQRIQAATWNRVLITTENEHIGLASRYVRSGDKLCILFGCSVPVVLRPSAKNDVLVRQELGQELQHIVNVIKRGWRQYVQNKKQHHRRKTIAMVVSCRYWLEETEWLWANGWVEEDAEEAAYGQSASCIKSLVSRAMKSFSEWRHIKRVQGWRDGQGDNDTNPSSHEEGAQHDDGAHVPSPESMLGQRQEPNRSCSVSRPQALDWWEFELALVAGRHWKREVQKMKASRSAYANTLVTPLWKSAKHDKYQAFQSSRVSPERGVDNQPSILNDHAQPTTLPRPEDIQPWKSAELPSFICPLTVKPGWIRQHGECQVLQPEEQEVYEAIFRRKMQIRLGEDAYFSYEFLGEAYVHGMMDGEAVKNRGKNERDILFEIR
jgi:hypothetical protein